MPVVPRDPPDFSKARRFYESSVKANKQRASGWGGHCGCAARVKLSKWQKEFRCLRNQFFLKTSSILGVA